MQIARSLPQCNANDAPITINPAAQAYASARVQLLCIFFFRFSPRVLSENQNRLPLTQQSESARNMAAHGPEGRPPRGACVRALAVVAPAIRFHQRNDGVQEVRVPQTPIFESCHHFIREPCLPQISVLAQAVFEVGTLRSPTAWHVRHSLAKHFVLVAVAILHKGLLKHGLDLLRSRFTELAYELLRRIRTPAAHSAVSHLPISLLGFRFFFEHMIFFITISVGLSVAISTFCTLVAMLAAWCWPLLAKACYERILVPAKRCWARLGTVL